MRSTVRLRALAALVLPQGLVFPSDAVRDWERTCAPRLPGAFRTSPPHFPAALPEAFAPEDP